MKTINFEEILALPQCLDSNEVLYHHPIVLYGAGVGGEYCHSYLQQYNVKPVAICDTYKAGQEFLGYTVSSIEEVKAQYPNPKIIITSIRFFEQIKAQLLKHFPEDALISFVSEITHEKLTAFKRFVKNNTDGLNSLYNQLEDDQSKETLINVIKGKITGDNQWVQKVFAPNQYFPQDIIALGRNESFIDGGAYVGDTAQIFIEKTSNCFDNIFCFEPSPKNFVQLELAKQKLQQDPRLHLFKAGLYSQNTRLWFDDSSIAPSNSICDQESATGAIEVVSIDKTINERVTFIKMDIEGAELEALKGARETILKYRPKLAICVYHNPQDLIDIPNYIMSLGLDYKYYLRHHSPYDFFETVFYAV